MVRDNCKDLRQLQLSNECDRNIRIAVIKMIQFYAIYLVKILFFLVAGNFMFITLSWINFHNHIIIAIIILLVHIRMMDG